MSAGTYKFLAHSVSHNFAGKGNNKYWQFKKKLFCLVIRSNIKLMSIGLRLCLRTLQKKKKKKRDINFCNPILHIKLEIDVKYLLERL